MSAARGEAKGSAKKPAAPATNGHSNGNKADKPAAAKPATAEGKPVANGSKPPLREKPDGRQGFKGATKGDANSNKKDAPPRDNKRDTKRPTTAPATTSSPKKEEPKAAAPARSAVKQVPLNAAISGMSFLEKVRQKEKEAAEAKAAAEAAANAPPPTEKKPKAAKPAKAEEKEAEKKEKKPKAEKKPEAKAEEEKPTKTAEPKEKKEKPARKEEKPADAGTTAVLPAPKTAEKKEKPARPTREGKAVAPPSRAEEPAKEVAIKKEISDDMDDKFNKPDASKDPVVPTQSKPHAQTSSWAPPTAAPRAVAEQSPVKPAIAEQPAPVMQQPAPVQVAPVVQHVPVPAAAAPVTATKFQSQAEPVVLPDYVRALAAKTRKLRFHQPTEQQPTMPTIQQGNPQALAYQQQQQQVQHREPFARQERGQWTHPQPRDYGRPQDSYGQRYNSQPVGRSPNYGGSYGQQQQQSFRPQVQPQAQGVDPFGFNAYKDNHHGAPGAHRETAHNNLPQQQPIGGQRPTAHAQNPHSTGGWGMTTDAAPL